MNKFYQKMREEDKVKHLKYSFFIFMVLQVFCPLMVALLLTFFIGVAKEIWDKYYGSGYCWYDMAANCIGIVVALLLSVLIKVMV